MKPHMFVKANRPGHPSIIFCQVCGHGFVARASMLWLPKCEAITGVG